MTPEEAVYARLIALATTAGDRLFPLRMPQPPPVRPLIVYQRISAPRQYTQDGDTGLVEPRVQLTLWADKYTAMMVLYNEVRVGFSGHKDDAAGMQHTFLMFELEEWEEQSGMYRKMVDLQIGFKES